ncbi:MAG: hypothetical protein A2Y78_04965 [Acidobacteria bacterium RBG_13_68_16]|nr:MAG: hypothetical protein A2Y78_04965 [Acidobacteria bacterium RBG_13_68_16]
MHALKLLAVYFLTLITFLAIDSVWLGLIAKDMYRRELGHLLAPNVRWGAALVFYVIYIAGLLILVVLPHKGSPLLTVAALGALFGLVAYATYDLTNLATLTRWPLSVTLADLAWGAVVTGVTAIAGRGYARWLLT